MAVAGKQEVLWINTLKGGCILLVVLHHTIITTFIPSIQYLAAGVMPAEIWIAFNKYLSPLRMPAFFFVSGLLAASAISKKSWSEVFTKKFVNILYLYILWGVIQWLSIYNISANLIGQKLSSAQNAAYASSPLEFVKLLALSMTSLWYLYALAFYFLAAKLFYRYRVALLVAAITVNYATQFNLVPGWGPNSVVQNYVYFLLGAFFSYQLIELSQLSRRHLVLLGGMLLLGMAHHAAGMIKNPFYCIVAIVLGIVLCRALNNRFNMSWLNWVGRNTLQIYVLHRIFIEILGLTMLTLAVKYSLFANHAFSLGWALLLPPLAVSITTCISLLVWKLLNRGPGKLLFIYPALLRKDKPAEKVASNG
ncbi:acyltransferase family protein [Erwinia tasmaniensis]|uniref:Inner membrane protein YcfT n=1 Tax=Erwinia tasmaniensis (strain DSM 17950 / CFBP 7177 / CIP 109463 / NCPPB 4357 / Et1/99) TaxID=465817 RepID=B2VFF1_ERWT9|nr:acyltransferase family protein [Erwinia tasmaniensis]CAO96475.1 Inner membrane protein YcfT [Erwinia tasmaniensis Et1/99]